MDPEEREVRVGHRIDEGIDQGSPVLGQFVVLAAEGHDSLGRVRCGLTSEAIAVEAAAGDDQSRLESPAVVDSRTPSTRSSMAVTCVPVRSSTAGLGEEPRPSVRQTLV